MKWTHAVALMVGGLLGAISLYAWIAVSGHPVRDVRDYTQSAGLSTQELGERLLGRAGREFVADSRQKGAAIGGVSFYAQPKPYGEFLCRVDLVSVPAKVVKGRSDGKRERWDDDVAVATLYAPWTKPNAPESGDRRDTACAKFRDFSRLIWGDPFAIERALRILDRVASEGASAPGFHITCVDQRDGNPKPCDGLQRLRAVRIEDIGGVHELPTGLDESKGHVDEIEFHSTQTGCGRTEMVTLKLASRPAKDLHPLEDGEPTAMEFTVESIC